MEQYNEILEKAFTAAEQAYVPYSHFRVGACIKTKDGTYITGCNIENASFGLTNCAERTAMFTAYAMGYRKEDIENLAVVARSEMITSPCGACRQVMVELLNPDTPVVMSNGKEIKVMTVEELMPLCFSQKNL